MNRFAVLLGDSPEDFRQKKLVEMQEFLTSEEGGALSERNIVVFPNGASELLLESVLNNILDGSEADSVLLYLCSKNPISDSDESIWLGGEEIRRDVIAYYENFAKKLEIDFQILFDFDSEFVSEEALGFEKVS